ncbi:MAG: glutamyl-tRNA reductase [Acidobacteria bacterium]|nr:glutamyl-tRNA reductase [Acidobacteriota bacterium]
MTVFVLGVNHKTASIELREQLAFTPVQSQAWAAWLVAQGIVREAVILSTCNRTEIYGVSPEPIETAAQVRDLICKHRRLDSIQLRDCVYEYSDVNAVRHLFHVASSLDSMVVGEPQILGQVRQAYRTALENGTTGPATNPMFQRALRVGKRVRHEVPLGQGRVSISSVIVQLAESILLDLSVRPILVLGLGKMGSSTIQCLADAGAKNIWVTSRSSERPEPLDDSSACAIPWRELQQAILECDLIISALAVEQCILSQQQIQQVITQRPDHPLLLIDIGLPRNIDPGVRRLNGVVLYDLDDIHRIMAANKQAREKHIPEAERLIEDEVWRFCYRTSRVSKTSDFNPGIQKCDAR